MATMILEIIPMKMMFNRTPLPIIFKFFKIKKKIEAIPEYWCFLIIHWSELYHMTTPVPITAKGIGTTMNDCN